MYKKISILCFLSLIVSSCSLPTDSFEYDKDSKTYSQYKIKKKLSIPIYIDYESELDLKKYFELDNDSNVDNIRWRVRDESIAEVDSLGIVKGLKEGTTIITAFSKNETERIIILVCSNNFNGIWSPTEDKIVFMSNAEDKSNLYVTTPYTNNKKILGKYFLDINSVSYQWSPDGSKVAFFEYKSLSIVDINTNNKVSFTTDIEYGSSLKWSPDGSKIAFISSISDRSNYEYNYILNLNVINIDGSNHRKITNNSIPTSFDYDWSPDSKKIAYNINKNNLNIFDLNLGKNNFIAKSKDFCWLSDSSKLIYVPFQEELDKINYVGSKIFKINTDGNNKQLFLDSSDINYSNMILSPDKKSIVLIGSKQLNKDDFNTQLQDIFLVSNDGSNLKKITNNTFKMMSMPDNNNQPFDYKYPTTKYNEPLIWSPDSKVIAIPVITNIRLNSNSKGVKKLCTIFTESSQIKEHDIFVPQDNFRDSKKSLSWSTDSKKIIFESKRSNDNSVDVNEIYSLDINSLKIDMVTTSNLANNQKGISDILDQPIP